MNIDTQSPQFKNFLWKCLYAIAALALVLGIFYFMPWLRDAISPSYSIGKQRFATVDLAAVVAIKEREFTEILSKKEATDQDRARAYELVQRMGIDLDKALESIQLHCDCTLIVSSAIVRPQKTQLPDFTQQLKAALGIAPSSSPAFTPSPLTAPTGNTKP